MEVAAIIEHVHYSVVFDDNEETVLSLNTLKHGKKEGGIPKYTCQGTWPIPEAAGIPQGAAVNYFFVVEKAKTLQQAIDILPGLYEMHKKNALKKFDNPIVQPADKKLIIPQ